MINFDRLVEEKNLSGLVAALRYRLDPDLRLAAARTLGGLDNLDAVEPLIRSYLEDPNLEVRAAALSSLKELIGPETSLAIQTYRAGSPDPEPWLSDGGLEGLPQYPDDEEVSEYLGEDEETTVQPLSDDEVRGLINILAGERDVTLRLKAIRAISRSHDARAVAILAQSAYYSSDEAVRKAARHELESIYGDETDTIIASLLPEDPEEEWEEDGVESEEELDEFAEAEIDESEVDAETGYDTAEEEEAEPAPRRTDLTPAPLAEVMREEGTPWLWLLAAAAVILIIVVILILLLV